VCNIYIYIYIVCVLYILYVWHLLLCCLLGPVGQQPRVGGEQRLQLGHGARLGGAHPRLDLRQSNPDFDQSGVSE